MILRKPSPKAEVTSNIRLVSLMHISESQKDLNKQIETHKTRQVEIAQGMHNSLQSPSCGGYGILHAALLVLYADFCIAMEKERLEAIEAERAIAEFSRKKESLMEYRQSLLKQIEETRQSLQKKRERMS